MEYFREHHLDVYIEDATAQLLEQTKTNPKIEPLPFLHQYFTAVRSGLHVFDRSYDYITATPHNRRSFIKLVWQIFGDIGRSEITMNGYHHHQLLELICPDIPVVLSHQVMDTILLRPIPQQRDTELVSFVDYIYTFQVLFYYHEFLKECQDVFSSHKPIVISTTRSSSTNQSALDTDTVVSDVDNTHNDVSVFSSFAHSIKSLHRKLTATDHTNRLILPPLTILEQLVTNCSTFEAFRRRLCKWEPLNKIIGVLPPKESFLSTEPPPIDN